MIIGSGPAAHTAAIYAGRAELEPLLFEVGGCGSAPCMQLSSSNTYASLQLQGFMANDIAAGGQLTTTTYIENFPGFVEPILGLDLTDNFR